MIGLTIDFGFFLAALLYTATRFFNALGIGSFSSPSSSSSLIVGLTRGAS